VGLDGSMLAYNGFTATTAYALSEGSPRAITEIALPTKLEEIVVVRDSRVAALAADGAMWTRLAGHWAPEEALSALNIAANPHLLADDRRLGFWDARGIGLEDPTSGTWSRMPDPPGGFGRLVGATLLDSSKLLAVDFSGRGHVWTGQSWCAPFQLPQGCETAGASAVDAAQDGSIAVVACSKFVAELSFAP
jgi:hypothetical protein